MEKVLFLNGLNIALGVLFQWLLITKIGISASGDMLIILMAGPQFIIAIIGNSIQNILLPIYKTRSSGKKIQEISCFWKELGLVMIGIGAIVALFSGLYACKVRSCEFDIVKIIALNLILLFWSTLSVLQSVTSVHYLMDERFIDLEKINIIGNMVALALMMFDFDGMEILIVSCALLSRAVAVALLMYVDYPIRSKIKLFESVRTKLIYSRVKYLILTASYLKSEILVDRFILARGGAGDLTIYYTVQQINSMIQQLFNRTVTNPYFVKICGNVKNKKKISATEKNLMHSKIKTAFLLTLMLFALLALASTLGKDFYGNLFGMEVGKITTIKNVMLAAIGILAGSLLSQILVSTFFSLGDSKTPMKISLITFSCSVPAKIIAFELYGVIGFTIATSLYYIADASIQFLKLSFLTKQGNQNE